jgi:transcriptional regulator with XRE-family HTH domain
MATEIVDVASKKTYIAIMLTPEQSRAARGWLDWSQLDLAKRANVSLSTVRDFEKGRRVPIANNLEALQRAIDAAGVQLVTRQGRPVGIAIFDPTNGEES